MSCNRCEARESSIFTLEARLSDREKQLSDLFDKYKKEKFQFKARLLQLRRRLSTQEQADGVESFEKFIENFHDDETLLLRYRSEIAHLNDVLLRKNTEINDHKIRIRDLEQKVRDATVDEHRHHGFSRETALKHDKDVLALFEAELQNFYGQIEQKDKRLLQLNEELEKKKEQVQTLVEACSEKDEIIRAKTRANQILQKQLLQMTSKHQSDKATETDSVLSYSADDARSASGYDTPSPPGCAVACYRVNLPKPADGTENSSVTTDLTADTPSLILDKSESFPQLATNSSTQTLNLRLSGMLNQIETLQSRLVSLNSTTRVSHAEDQDIVSKKRVKKVTFDLTDQELKQELADTYEKLKQAELAASDLYEENEELRLIIAGLENNIQNDLKAVFVEESLQQATRDLKQSENKVQQLMNRLNEMKKERKCAVLRAKAQQTARIKQLEGMVKALEDDRHQQLLRTDALSTENDRLRTSLVNTVKLADISSIVHTTINDALGALWRVVDEKISAIDTKFTELLSRLIAQNSTIHALSEKKRKEEERELFRMALAPRCDDSGCSAEETDVSDPDVSNPVETSVPVVRNELPSVVKLEGCEGEKRKSEIPGVTLPGCVVPCHFPTSVGVSSFQQKVASLKVLNMRLDKIVATVMRRYR